MPQHTRLFRMAHTGEIQQHAEAHPQRILRRTAAMNMPDRIIDLGVFGFACKFLQVVQVLIHGLRNHVEVKALCRLRLLVHEQRQTFRRGVLQPLVHGQTIALGLGNLLTPVV